MTTVSFSALVKFPSSEYFRFNEAISGIATIDSISREGEFYNANADFDLDTIAGFVTALTSVSGELVEIVQNKSYDVPKKTTKTVGKFLSPKTTKKEELINLLSDWKTTKQLEKATGWQSTTIHARLTGLRHAKSLQQKVGTDGFTAYKMKKIAA